MDKFRFFVQRQVPCAGYVGTTRWVRSGSSLALLTAIIGLATSGCATPGKPHGQVEKNRLPTSAIRLESLDLAAMDQGWESPKAGLSAEGNPMTIDGTVYEHGVGTHAYSEMIIELNGAATRFHAIVGVDDETEDRGSIVFIVYLDGHEVARTDVLRGDGPAETIDVDLRGGREITLVVDDAGDGMGSDHADWADAYLVLKPDAKERPVALLVPPGPDPVIAVDRSPQPKINAPRITGATPGLPFLFRIPACGNAPLTFAAQNLPAGLVLDPDTGIITGSLAAAGETAVNVTVTNDYGTASSVLTIVGGTHKLALTPPMGWNSWNVWGTSVDDEKVRAAADWLVESGLADYGFRYINIDDAWEAERDENGRILPNEKFPDMKALADYVHSKGLKLGIYSSPGPKTCGGYEGSYQHEFQDAQTYADWGIDLIKYDWCSYGGVAQDETRAEYRKPYELMREALDACGRDIVYSLCQYGMDNVWEWGADVGGNYWRTTGDIVDTWSSMSHIGFSQARAAPYAGPGHWNDPDMLVVGMVGWGPELHPSRLSKNEQVTHITLWSLLASPLLIGCDLSQLDDFTLAVLTNPEVLDVNQDPLGKAAARVGVDGRQEVWARPLADGTLAVGLFNRDRRERTVTASWGDLGLDGPQPVRNLWERSDEGTFEQEYSADIPGHGAIFLKIGTPR